MKSWMWFPFVLLLGWVMGAWLPKAELRLAREELSQARQALKAKGPRRAGFGGVTQMLGIPEADRDGREATEAPSAGDGTTVAPDATDSTSVSVSNAAVEELEAPRTNRPPRGESMKQGIEQAMEAWEARSDIARATFASNVGLDEAQANRFDVLVAAMNIRLAHAIEQFAGQVKTGQKVGEEQTIKLMRDLTASVAMTYDELDAAMPPNWRRDAGEEFSATDFIDPSVALPLTDIEDELDDGVFRDHP